APGAARTSEESPECFEVRFPRGSARTLPSSVATLCRGSPFARRIGTAALARFFKYRSRADLEADASRLGLDLRFSDDLGPLFRPVRIGPWQAAISLCTQPMEGCDGPLDGRPDELPLRRYRRFGAGGAKLLWGEATAVVEEGRANSRQL